MIDEVPFAELISRVRMGDADAAADLVHRYGRAVRVAIRVRLTDPNLRRQFDSMDVCQSVLASFFVRAAAGQFDLTEPGQLIGLLVKMAKNKLLMQMRRHGQQKRNAALTLPLDEGTLVPDVRPGPASIVAAKELLATLLDRLTPDERTVAARRAVGRGWVEIATELGETPQAVRMRLARAVARIAPGLGLDDFQTDEK